MQRHGMWHLSVRAFVLLGLGLCLGASRPGVSSEGCHPQDVARTFFQPWRADADRSPEAWSTLFAELRRLGFSDVILQWTSYGSLLIYRDTRAGYESRPYLDKVVHAAHQHQIQLWLGLHYDPDFWSHIDPQKQQTKIYLNRRLVDLSLRLPALVTDIERADPAGETIRGWYISDEIDDVNWQTPARKEMLLRYLQSLRRLLDNHRPHWPVLISGFANGAQSPQVLAVFWQDLLKRSGIDTLLFQDGIGAEKLSLSNLGAYLAALKDHLGASGHAFEVIVEVFRISKAASEPFTTEAADCSRVLQQLQLAQAHSQGTLTVFSAPDHMLPERGLRAKLLNSAWLRALHRCNCKM